MCKILVLGDIHGRAIWKNIIAKENPDKVIFLGDYVSTHELISEKTQVENLEEILQYKESNPDKVILLRGNHDLESLNYSWAECYPKTGPIIKKYMEDNKDRFLANTQWIYIDNKILFSHAGISFVWIEQQGFKLEEINNYSPNESFSFIPDNYADDSGTSKSQSCVWIRPSVLKDCAYMSDTYTQVVGHSTVQKPYNMHNSDIDFPNVWLCDCLPRGYLTIEDGVFTPKVFKDFLGD